MKLPYITNIQKYSIHDGTGIRTTVFFKGCPLSCKWCHNPETQKYDRTILCYPERCAGCGACAAVCPRGAVRMRPQTGMPEADLREPGNKAGDGMEGQIREHPVAVTDHEKCMACGICEEECLHSARELCGKTWEIRELAEEVLKDRPFYETSGGGVTLSGGEVLSQDMEYIETLIRTLYGRGVKLFVDTCGAVPREHFERVLPYTDTFLFDIKLMDEEKHIRYTGQSNQRILENLKWLSQQGASLWIRIPVIGGVNDDREEMSRIAAFLKDNRIGFRQINLLPYHNTGSGKYLHLDREYEGEDFYVPTTEYMESLKEWMEQEGLGPVMIGG